jgi:hypothetical protein
VGKPSGGDELKEAPDHWVVAGGQIRCSQGGLYLTFDPEDKDGKVFLAEKPVRGAEWLVRAGKGNPKHFEIPFRGSEWGTIEASSGALKGCCLDVEVPKGENKDVHLLLSKGPKSVVEIARLYTHK